MSYTPVDQSRSSRGAETGLEDPIRNPVHSPLILKTTPLSSLNTTAADKQAHSTSEETRPWRWLRRLPARSSSESPLLRPVPSPPAPFWARVAQVSSLPRVPLPPAATSPRHGHRGPRPPLLSKYRMTTRMRWTRWTLRRMSPRCMVASHPYLFPPCFV
jgi:hypothetical protein